VTISTRCSHLTKPAMLAATVAALALAQARPANAGGAIEVVCTGTRIYENGRCVDPPAQVATPSPSAAPSAGPVTPSAGAGAALASPGAIQLTEPEIAVLKNAGARLDAKDMAMANRLGRKGFSGDDFVAAYREYSAMKIKYPQLAPFGRDIVETIALAQRLGLSGEDEYRFVWDHHQGNQTLAQAYNASLPHGRGLVTFGAVTTGVGIGLLIGGMVLANDVTYESGRGNVTSGWGYGGKAMEIAGGVSIAAGLSIAIIGLYRWTTPLATPRDPDSADKSQSLRRSASAHRESVLGWAFLPSFGPKHAGLGLATEF